MQLTIDCREHKLAEILDQNNIEYQKQALDVGDIIVQDDHQRQIIIERKTWDDLKSSFVDGRFREQRSRLLQLVAGSPDIKIAYIIEGEYNSDYMNEKKGLYRLQFAYQIPVFFTYNLESTTKLLQQWLLHNENLDHFFIARSIEEDQIESRVKTKKKNYSDPRLFFGAVFSIMKGLPVTLSIEIINEFQTIQEFVTEYHKDKDGWMRRIENITYQTKNTNTKKINKNIILKIQENFGFL